MGWRICKLVSKRPLFWYFLSTHLLIEINAVFKMALCMKLTQLLNTKRLDVKRSHLCIEYMYFDFSS